MTPTQQMQLVAFNEVLMLPGIAPRCCPREFTDSPMPPPQLRFGSTAKALAECKLKYYRIQSQLDMVWSCGRAAFDLEGPFGAFAASKCAAFSPAAVTGICPCSPALFVWVLSLSAPAHCISGQCGQSTALACPRAILELCCQPRVHDLTKGRLPRKRSALARPLNAICCADL